MAITLPTKRSKAIVTNPRELIIYAAPKAGKTTSVSMLDDCLIIDLENGTDYVDAMSVKCNSLDDIRELHKTIMEAGRPYKYIAIDTITKLEEFAEKYALELYKKTPIGKNFTGASILNLPNGWGYHWLRIAFMKLKDAFRSMADYVIYIWHIKDKRITTDGENEMTSVDLNLTGKNANILASYVDGIGQLKRVGNTTILSFTASEINPLMGCRSAHLSGKDILLTEKNEDGTFTSHWEDVYINAKEDVKQTYVAPQADLVAKDEADQAESELANKDVVDEIIAAEAESGGTQEAEKPKRNVGKKKQEADAKKATSELSAPVGYVSPNGNTYTMAESSFNKIVTFIMEQCTDLTKADAFAKYKTAIANNEQAMKLIDEISMVFDEYFDL